GFVTYGAPPITLSATASSGLPVTYTVIAGPGRLSGTNNSILTITGGGGRVTVAADQPGNGVIGPAPRVTQSVMVYKAPLTFTADNKTMKYGQAVPALTWTVTGFVNGETAASVLTGAPALSTTVTSTSAPGIYKIKIAKNTLAAANYLLPCIFGTLTVQPLGTVT